MKRLLQDAEETRSTLVDWVPLFDRDYRYTLNFQAYITISWVIGIGAIVFGLIIFITQELPYVSWKETTAAFKMSTESLCLIETGDSNERKVTYRYLYTVDGKTYQSERAFCDSADGTRALLYNPANPSDAVPVPSIKAGAIVAFIGIFIIVFGYIVSTAVSTYLK